MLPSNQIRIEQKLPLAESMKEEDRLVRDISVRDMWNDDRISIFDMQLICPLCKSRIKTNTEKLLDSREKAKKTKCIGRCKKHKLNFISCAAAINLVLGPEFNRNTKSIAKRLELKYKKTSFSH